jgi:hypothetical protein
MILHGIWRAPREAYRAYQRPASRSAATSTAAYPIHDVLSATAVGGCVAGSVKQTNNANTDINLMKKNTQGELRAYEIRRRKPSKGYIDPTAERGEPTATNSEVLHPGAPDAHQPLHQGEPDAHQVLHPGEPASHVLVLHREVHHGPTLLDPLSAKTESTRSTAWWSPH